MRFLALPVVMAGVVVLASACGLEPAVLLEPCDSDGGVSVERLRCDPDAGLCGYPVQRRLRQADRTKAIDVLFVGERFASTGDLRSLTQGWYDELEATSPTFSEAAPITNLYWLDTGHNDRRASLMGACRDRSDTSTRISFDDDLQLFRHGQADQFDVVVIVVDAADSVSAYGSWPFYVAAPRVVMTSEGGAGVLAHELGHSLFGLNDEYSRTGQPKPSRLTVSDVDLGSDLDTVFFTPNLTLDPNGAKFAAFGARPSPGGGALEAGVFHPEGECRMNTHDHGYCSVCAAAAHRVIAAKKGENDGVPSCGVIVDWRKGLVTSVAWDWNGLASTEVEVDGVSLSSFGPTRFARRETQRLDADARQVTIRCLDSLGAKATHTLTRNWGQ